MELRQDNLDQLAQVHRELGFKYVRFNAIFTDNMHVYREQDGRPIYDWNRFDELYDKLIAARMKPFVELSFMPKSPTSDDEQVFYWSACVSAKRHDKVVGSRHGLCRASAIPLWHG